MAMFQKAEEYIGQALKKGLNAQLKKELEQLQRESEGQKFSVHAHSVLTVDEPSEQGAKAVVKSKKVCRMVLFHYILYLFSEFVSFNWEYIEGHENSINDLSNGTRTRSFS